MTAREKHVPLSDGTTATVRRVTWGGYVPFRNFVFEALAGKLTQSVLALLQGPATELLAKAFTGPAPQDTPQTLAEYAAQTEAPAEGTPLQNRLTDLLPLLDKTIAQLKSELPSLLQGAKDVQDQLTAILLEHAVALPVGVSLESMDWQDVATLVQEAYALNDPAELLAREKNFWEAVATSGRKILTTALTTSPGTSS